jgi:hypothetical protein
VAASEKKLRFPQESSSQVAHFSVPENVVLNHHIHHANHHKFTTQKPPVAHPIFRNTPQKCP